MGQEKNAENIPFLRSTQPKSTERVPVVELSGSDQFSEENGWSSDWDPCDFSVYRKVGDPDRCYIESVEGFGGPNFEAVYSTEWPTEHAEVRGRWGGTSIKIEEYGKELSDRLFERAESDYPAEY